jgi:hypothetical protein
MSRRIRRTGDRERTRFESNVFDASFMKTIDDFLGLLGRRNTSSDTETFDSSSLLLHLLPERKLESELTLVDVESVESDSNSRFVDQLLNLVDLGTHCLFVVMSSSSEFDVVTSLENSRNESSFDGGRSPVFRNEKGFHLVRSSL